MVLEVLSREFREDLPMELLYSDLVLMAETEELLMEKILKLRTSMDKGLKVNLGKTKVMKCLARCAPTENFGKWQCEVCRKGIGSNSIKCNRFMESVVVYLINCRIWLVSNVRGVLRGSCFEKLWP